MIKSLTWDNATDIKLDLINAALLNVYFILHYYLFFRKEVYRLKCSCFSEYDIWMSLYIFWLKKQPSIKYVRNCLYKSSGAGWPFCAEIGYLLSSDCNWTRTQNHLVLKRTLNHLAKLVWPNGWVFV